MESAKPVGPPTAIYKIYRNPQHAILRYPLHCYHGVGDIIILYKWMLTLQSQVVLSYTLTIQERKTPISTRPL